MVASNSRVDSLARALQKARPDFNLSRARDFARTILAVEDGAFGSKPLPTILVKKVDIASATAAGLTYDEAERLASTPRRNVADADRLRDLAHGAGISLPAYGKWRPILMQKLAPGDVVVSGDSTFLYLDAQGVLDQDGSRRALDTLPLTGPADGAYRLEESAPESRQQSAQRRTPADAAGSNPAAQRLRDVVAAVQADWPEGEWLKVDALAYDRSATGDQLRSFLLQSSPGALSAPKRRRAIEVALKNAMPGEWEINVVQATDWIGGSRRPAPARSGLSQYVTEQAYGADLPHASQDQISAGESASAHRGYIAEGDAADDVERLLKAVAELQREFDRQGKNPGLNLHIDEPRSEDAVQRLDAVSVSTRVGELELQPSLASAIEQALDTNLGKGWKTLRLPSLDRVTAVRVRPFSSIGRRQLPPAEPTAGSAAERYLDGGPHAVIGRDRGEQDVAIDLRANPHWYIAGATGTGKSQLLRGLLEELGAAGAMLYVGDTKGTDYLDLTAPMVARANDAIEGARLVRLFRDELAARRGARSNRSRQVSGGDVPTANPFPPGVLVLDVFDILCAELSHQFSDRGGVEDFFDDLTTILRVGREFGMHLILAGQRPVLPPEARGRGWEAILKARIFLGYSGISGLLDALPSSDLGYAAAVAQASIPASQRGAGVVIADDAVTTFQMFTSVAAPSDTYTSYPRFTLDITDDSLSLPELLATPVPRSEK